MRVNPSAVNNLNIDSNSTDAKINNNNFMNSSCGPGFSPDIVTTNDVSRIIRDSHQTFPHINGQKGPVSQHLGLNFTNTNIKPFNNHNNNNNNFTTTTPSNGLGMVVAGNQMDTQSNGIISLAHPSSYPHIPHPRQSSFSGMDQYNNCSTTTNNLPMATTTSLSCMSNNNNNIIMATPGLISSSTSTTSATSTSDICISTPTTRTTNINNRPSNIHEILSSDPTALMNTDFESNNNNTNNANTYNGIYLVDGLGHGVRIDNRITTHQLPVHPDPAVYQYGLPPVPVVPLSTSTTTTTSPQSIRVTANEKSSFHHQPNNSSSSSSTLQPIISTSIKIFDTNNENSRMSTGNYNPNVTCTSQLGHPTQPYPNNNNSNNTFNIINHNHHHKSSSTPVVSSANSTGVSSASRSMIANPISPSAVIPVLGGGSNNTNNNMIVPKVCKRNSVTLPVPSPPHGNTVLSPPGLITVTSVPVVLSQSSSSELNNIGKVGMMTTSSNPTTTTTNTTVSSSPVTVLSSPTIINNSVTLGKSPGESRTVLISTEAQTEDLPTLAPPPPPPARNNREQRKRERRERRRDRNSVYGFSGHRNHGPSSASTSTRRDNVNTSGSAGESNPNSSNISSSETTSNQPSSGQPNPVQESSSGLPDLLNLPPPPYSTLPPPNCDRRALGIGGVPLQLIQHPQTPLPIPGPPPPTMLGPPNCPTLLGLPPPGCQPPNCLPNQPIRYHFSPPAPPLTRASRRSLRTPRGVPYASEEEPKSCCGMSTSQAVSIRWFIIVIAVIGICCTVAGTALGAARSAGSQHLTLSLLMIGVGVVLLTVSAVAWRLTANESGSSSCRAMLGITRNGNTRGDGGSEPNRVFVPRLPPSYGRPHHPYAAMMYPDFQYRPPPPSYQASMQEYRLRLLLLERSNPTIAAAAAGVQSALNMVPPPPAYRPYNATLRPGLHGRTEVVDYSRPPSYRSRTSGSTSTGQDSCTTVSRDPSGIVHSHHRIVESPLHSRDPSLLSYLSQQSMGDNVSVVSGSVHHHHNHPNSSAVVTVMDLGLGYVTHHEDLSNEEVVSGVEAEDDKEFPSSVVEVDDDRDELKIGHSGSSGTVCTEKSKDGNLVRIVQTTDSSQVIGRDSVIVTVSGSPNNCWDNNSSLQHPQSQYSTNVVTNNSHSHHQPHPTTPNQQQSQYHRFGSTGDNNTSSNEVQILAHL